MSAFKFIKAGSFFSAALILLWAGSPAGAASPAKQTRAVQYQTLNFPDNVAVAHLDVWTPSIDAKGAPSTVKTKVTAQGRIKVPTNAHIVMKLTYDGLDHLDTLAQFNPGQVTELNASRLDLTDAHMTYFKKFTSITRLNLDSTLITDKSLPILAAYKGLSDVRLSITDVTGAGFESLADLPIWLLNMEGTDLREGCLAKLKRLPETLVNINCSKTHIGPEDIAFLSKCQKLTGMGLDGNNKITDACVKDIVKLKLLDSLSIADTLITEKSLPALAKMPNLKQLVVRNKTFWKLGSGKSPRPTLQIRDSVAVSRTPVDVFGPLH